MSNVARAVDDLRCRCDHGIGVVEVRLIAFANRGIDRCGIHFLLLTYLMLMLLSCCTTSWRIAVACPLTMIYGLLRRLRIVNWILRRSAGPCLVGCRD